jgi:hypothetical protein
MRPAIADRNMASLISLITILLTVEVLAYRKVYLDAYDLKMQPIYLEQGRTPLNYYAWQDEDHRYVISVLQNGGTLTFENVTGGLPPFKTAIVGSITGVGTIRVPAPQQDQDMYVDSTGTAEVQVQAR